MTARDLYNNKTPKKQNVIKKKPTIIVPGNKLLKPQTSFTAYNNGGVY